MSQEIPENFSEIFPGELVLSLFLHEGKVFNGLDDMTEGFNTIL